MADIHTPFGRVYEDFEAGDVIHHWPGRTITQTDDIHFSQLTLNQHPLYAPRPHTHRRPPTSDADAAASFQSKPQTS